MALLFALLAPDFDIALGLLLGYGPFELHGGAMHSLFLAPVFGVLWAAATRVVVFRGLSTEQTQSPFRWTTLWVLGTAAYAAHVGMDWLTPGRGVGLFWPINDLRWGSPIKLFVGVEHSNWRDWGHHVLTLGTEGAFAFAVWLIGIWVARQRDRADAAVTGQHPEPVA